MDERQHCFLIQSFGKQSHYFSVETRQVGWRQTHDHDLINTLDNSICTQELLRLESAWHKSVCLAISHLGSKTFHVVYKNKPSAFTLGKSSPKHDNMISRINCILSRLGGRLQFEMFCLCVSRVDLPVLSAEGGGVACSLYPRTVKHKLSPGLVGRRERHTETTL